MASFGHSLVWLVCCLCLGLTGCVVAAASSPDTRDGPVLVAPTAEPVALPLVRVAFTELSGANVALWMTHAADLFRKHGLQVSLAQRPEASAYAGLAGDELDVVVGSGAAALAAAAEGAELRIVAGLVNVSPYRLMVVPGVESAADLRDIRLGVARPGSTQEIATRTALERLGLELGTDVAHLQIGNAAERLAALENGAVQGAAVAPPDTVLLDRLGFGTLVDLLARGEEVAGTQVIVAERLARDEPGRLQRFVYALVEGIAFAKREPALAKRVLRHYLYTQDDAAIDATYALFVERLAQRTPYPAERTLRLEWSKLQAGGGAPERPSAAALIQRRFVQQAVDSGFVGQVYGGQEASR